MTLGRPTKLDDTILGQISALHRAGASVKTVCNIVGINQDTYYTWRRKGIADPDSVYGPFAETIARDRDLGKMRIVAMVDKAARDGDWRAGAWLLERMFPEEFMERQRLEHTGADGLPIGASVDLEKLSSEELEAMRLLLAKAGGTLGELNA